MKKFLFLIMVCGVLSCQPSDDMKFKIEHQQILQNIPSASGIVKHQDSYFVIGDDTPFLFKLNSELDVIARLPIYSVSEEFENSKIPKKNKPDFEALEKISDNEIIAFGSGSKSPERDVFVRISIDDSLSVQEYSLTQFYDALRKMEILQESELNIEGAAFYKDFLYLFNRGKNIIFKMNYTKFLTHLEEEGALPEITFSEYQLPEIKGIEAGFSGADVSETCKLIITASVENTDNAYDDGEVLGSFIGTAFLENDSISRPINWMEISGTTQPLKVESVTVDREISENEHDVILVTDSDGGESLLLKGNLKWEIKK